MRDLAWDKFNINKIEGIKFFHSIIKKYDDFYSYYSLGMIYEHDFPSPDSLIYYYTNALDKSDNEDLNQILIRMCLSPVELCGQSVRNFLA